MNHRRLGSRIIIPFLALYCFLTCNVGPNGIMEASAHHTAIMIFPPKDLKIVSYMGNNYCCGISEVLLHGRVKHWHLSENLHKEIATKPYQYYVTESGVVYASSTPPTMPLRDFELCEWVEIRANCNVTNSLKPSHALMILLICLLFLIIANVFPSPLFYYTFHPIMTFIVRLL